MRATSPLLLALALALLASAGCGGPPFFAEVADPRLCVTVPTQTVPAAPAGIGEHTVTWEGDLDVAKGIPGLEKQGATTGSVQMIELFMDPSVDASGVTTAEVAVTQADPADPTAHAVVQRATYERLAGSDPTKLIFAVASPVANLLPVLTARAGVLHYQVAFKGTPPTTAWHTDVTACVKASVTVDLTKL